MKYIVYVGNITKKSLENIKEYITTKNKKWEIIILQEHGTAEINETLYLDFNNSEEIQLWVKKYAKNILCITARSEKNIPLFQKIIPHLPDNILTPTVASLKKSTEKTEMRRAFRKHKPSISPKFKIIDDLNTIPSSKEIMKKMDFPVIVKPSGLASSMLVQAAHYPDELNQILINIKKKIFNVYKKEKGRGNPTILIEEIIDGDIYSIDAYTNNSGETYFTPFVKYRTSAQKGFDDFFLYERRSPTRLSKKTSSEGKNIAKEGIKALGLRNTTTHIELVLGDDGWKIIEIGPRIGGNREMIYEKCYGINHNINDLFIRIPKKKPIIKEKVLGYTSTIQFFPQKEGFITKIVGVKKVEKLKSYFETKQKLKKGDKSVHAKNGGSFVVQITLFNTNKAQFIEDKRKLEQMVHIETSSARKKK